MSLKQQEKETRRDIMLSTVRWAAAFIAAALIYPLLRFAGFTIKPKPRHVRISGPLPRSGFHAEQDFLLFSHQTEAWAISRTCTHLGCRVNFLEDQQIIECPCHQSRFTPQGQRIAGPARKNLPSYPVEVQKDAAGKITGYVVTI